MRLFAIQHEPTGMLLPEPALRPLSDVLFGHEPPRTFPSLRNATLSRRQWLKAHPETPGDDVRVVALSVEVIE